MLVFYVSLLTYCLYVLIKYRNGLYMLQQNSYNVSNRYIKWIGKSIKKVFVSFDFLYVLVIPFYFILDINFFCLINMIFFLVLFYLEGSKIKKMQVKKPFVVTSRIKRLILTIFVIFLFLSLVICFNYNQNDILFYYLIYLCLSYMSYFVVFIANIINKPIEKCVYYYYKNMALKKLNDKSNLIKIGITGSYGKTSSKNILNEILNAKYNSFATPKSFNTPYGLMNAINNYLDKFDNVFIAEMGACKLGDIKELCDFIKPSYGIVTKIGEAHLETFKTLENITMEKMKLIESLPKDGIGILNADDERQVSYHIKNNCKIIWIGIDNKDKADVFAKNIKIDNLKMCFDVEFKNEESYHFETSILGRANIYNILSAIALGKALGVAICDMQRVVKYLKPTEHRLSIKKLGDITIIDDAFNSNPDGSKMALEVLDLMNGVKIIVTPGMIELGSKQYELNYLFGKYISEVCDYVILVGKAQTKPIYVGLIDNNYLRNKIYVINDVKESFEIINKIDGKNKFVLLENDLPDIFNEK